MPKFCGECGATLPQPNPKFCPGCGFNLGTVVQPSSSGAAAIDPYADGNTTPAEKNLQMFKKATYVPPDHTVAPQIKTVPSLDGHDGSVYVPPKTSDFRAQVSHGEHLPGYKAPDHTSNIPIIKEQAKPVVAPDYHAPDHTSGIPVKKEQAQPVHAPGYKAPDHVSGIPILKEQAKAVHAPAYRAPDHTSNIPVIKEQPNAHQYNADGEAAVIDRVAANASGAAVQTYYKPATSSSKTDGPVNKTPEAGVIDAFYKPANQGGKTGGPVNKTPEAGVIDAFYKPATGYQPQPGAPVNKTPESGTVQTYYKK